MASYKIGVQKTPTGKFRLVLFSVDNGKLVMQGEPLNNRKDADQASEDIAKNWDMFARITTLIPATKKWPKNSGPKKAAKKVHKRDPLSKAFDASGSWRPTAGATKKK